MGETIHDVNGIEICAEVRGPDDGEPLLLVMGLGAQLVSWDERFLDGLVQRGYRVIRFDNRDVGRSTHFDDHPVDLMELFASVSTGEAPAVPYTLSDMAADAAGLLDALGVEAAHVVGASMGGMIVQTMAIEQAHKVRSVVSIMSTTGDPDVGQAAPEASGALLRPPPKTFDEALVAAREGDRIWGSPAYRDEAAVEDRAKREWDRVQNPAGVARQLAAVAASGSRTAGLRGVEMPFTVIHGLADTLVTPSGGRRTAEAVPHATLVEIEGMGHNLPMALWPRIFDLIDKTAAEA